MKGLTKFYCARKIRLLLEVDIALESRLSLRGTYVPFLYKTL